MSELILDHEFVHDRGSYSLTTYPPYEWRELWTCIKCGIARLGNRTEVPGAIGPVALFDGKTTCASRQAEQAEQERQRLEWENGAPERELLRLERLNMARNALAAGTITLTADQLRQLYDLARDDDLPHDLERDLGTVLSP